MGQASTTLAAYCRTCDYALTGLPEKHQCPECGRGFNLADPKSFRRRPRRGIWRRLRWVVYPLILLVLAGGGGVGWTWWQWKQEQPAIAWARAHPMLGGLRVSTKSFGPAWLQQRAGRWGYLLERADRVGARSYKPVTPADLPLSHLHRLTVLRLDGRGVGDELMGEVGALRELQALALSDTAVTDPGLGRLTACRRLEVLALAGSRVGDQGLAPLAGHPELTGLYLMGTPVDDRAVPILKGLTKLEILDLRGTKITPEGVAELKKALPNCQIEGP